MAKESIETTDRSTMIAMRCIVGGVILQSFCNFELDGDQNPKSHEGGFMTQLQDLQHPPDLEYEEDSAMAKDPQLSGLSEATPSSPVVQQPDASHSCFLCG